MVEYIIVQAGGKGTRLENLTVNKPKALVPVKNLPILFHLFKQFPDKKFIIIGDYKFDVLEKYLNAFAEVEYSLVCSSGYTGTCSGIDKALEIIPNNKSFLLIWSDLILADNLKLPNDDENYIGLSKDFSCRWNYIGDKFQEERSEVDGVAGYFIFKGKNLISDCPKEGEFVKYLSKKNIKFKKIYLNNTHEYGLISEIKKLPLMKCRPFNSVEIKDGVFIKKAITKQGEDLAKREVDWYKEIKKLDVNNEISIPKITCYLPLKMEYIEGKNIYEYKDFSYEKKLDILQSVIKELKVIHNFDYIDSDKESFYYAYIGKTLERLEKVKDLIPFAKDEYIKINGKVCKNILYYWDILEKEVMSYLPDKFNFIHGDCTFSNILLKNNSEPVFIDPRGYFGKTETYGDKAYDWVKLYYSLYGNYDQFNLKNFSLKIQDDSVYINIESNGWEELENEFFKLVGNEISKRQMMFMLSIIYVSLTTYAWEDYDSICGAFYQGVLYFNEALCIKESKKSEEYFNETLNVISDTISKIDFVKFDEVVNLLEKTVKNGNKIVVSGLGKNIAVCEKVVGTLLSLGINSNFLHTSNAVHGDLGMVRDGDTVIVLSKSGNTIETVNLIKHLKMRKVNIILLTFNSNSKCEKLIGKSNCVILNLKHEGDLWNIVPNNSTTLNLIVLQGMVMMLARKLGIDLLKDFKPNHPGGAIGEMLKNEE